MTFDNILRRGRMTIGRRAVAVLGDEPVAYSDFYEYWPVRSAAEVSRNLPRDVVEISINTMDDDTVFFTANNAHMHRKCFHMDKREFARLDEGRADEWCDDWRWEGF